MNLWYSYPSKFVIFLFFLHRKTVFYEAESARLAKNFLFYDRQHKVVNNYEVERKYLWFSNFLNETADRIYVSPQIWSLMNERHQRL